MKAVHYAEHGKASEVLQWRDDAPVRSECADGEVLLEVYAAALNPVDNAITNGFLKVTGLVYYTAVDRAIGGDVAGIVVKAGAGATIATGIDASGQLETKPAEVGDAVFGACRQGYGSFSEFAVVDSKQLVTKPPEVSFVDAASVPLAALTAYLALTHHSQVTAGSKVLVLGGSGGVGVFAVQIAVALGAGTVASTSSDSEFLSQLGVHVPINYHTQDWAEVLAGQDYDVVFAAVPEKTPSWEGAQRVLKKGGTYVALMGNSFPQDDAQDHSGEKFTLKEKDPSCMRKVLGNSTEQLFVSTGLTFTTDTVTMIKIRDLMLAGKLRPILHNGGPFDFSAEGWQALFQVNQSGRAKGKLVCNIKDGSGSPAL